MDENKSKVETKEPAKKEPVFSLSRLAKDCTELFGVSPSTFAGATYGLPKDGKHTVAEMKAHIKKWLDKSIDLGGRKVK